MILVLLGIRQNQLPRKIQNSNDGYFWSDIDWVGIDIKFLSSDPYTLQVKIKFNQ